MLVVRMPRLERLRGLMEQAKGRPQSRTAMSPPAPPGSLTRQGEVFVIETEGEVFEEAGSTQHGREFLPAQSLSLHGRSLEKVARPIVAPTSDEHVNPATKQPYDAGQSLGPSWLPFAEGNPVVPGLGYGNGRDVRSRIDPEADGNEAAIPIPHSKGEQREGADHATNRVSLKRHSNLHMETLSTIR